MRVISANIREREMEDDLSSMWNNFTLTEEEGALDEASEEEFIYPENQGSSCLVGRLMSD